MKSFSLPEKRIVSAAIFVLELIMFRLSSGPLSLELLPAWHRWSGRLGTALFAAFALVSAAIFLLRLSGREKHRIFELWGLVCLFLSNTLYAAEPRIQAALAVLLMLSLAHDGLFSGPGASAAVIAVFLVCMMLAALLVPVMARIEKPELYTDLENFWMDLFETRSGGSGASEPKPKPESWGGIPDNMITNDPFPGDDDTLICEIRSTYPLELLRVFSCGEYDTQSHSFSILDDPAGDPEGRSPSEDYFRQALSGRRKLPERAVITDMRPEGSMLLSPYCSFAADSEGILGFGDRFIYRNAAFSSGSLLYSFDPELSYGVSSSAYAELAEEEYLRLPEGFMEKLARFISERRIDRLDLRGRISAVEELLSREYSYSSAPPELPEGEDPVIWFLLESRTGHSKHFAAARVFLYRAAGIPARYSFGYEPQAYGNTESELHEGGEASEYKEGGAAGYEGGDTSGNESGGAAGYESCEAKVYRRDARAFCEIFVDGAWRLPAEVMMDEEDEKTPRPDPDADQEPSDGEAPIRLADGYDISHLRGSASMLGAYEGGHTHAIPGYPLDEDDDTVVLVVDTDAAVSYIRAYAAGDYDPASGSFSIDSGRGSWTGPDGISLGEYAAEAFMSDEGVEKLAEKHAGENRGYGEAYGFRVFNLFAPRYIYSPVLTVSRNGLAGDSIQSFGMTGDRYIVPISGSSASVYEDYTLLVGGTPNGPDDVYTGYAVSEYTRLPDRLSYELRSFLTSKGVDPDSPDKGALIDSVRSILSGYEYTGQIDVIPEGEDPVMWFLTVSRSGYCQHFAAAGTLLLRACGIPARFVSGYFREIPAGSVAEIRVRDAHAWTEVYDGSGWKLAEMCVGAPAEGQRLPEGLRAEELTYELPPSGAEGDAIDGSLILSYLIPLCALLLAAALALFVRRNRPDSMQLAYIRYRYISKYYYISEETERLLGKISYSREGASSDDLKALDKRFSDARSLLLFRKKYLSYALSMVQYAFWYMKETLRKFLNSDKKAAA